MQKQRHLLFFIFLLIGCGVTREDTLPPSSTARYFTASGKNPMVVTTPLSEAPPIDAILWDSVKRVSLETRYFSVTLPNSEDPSRLVRKIAGSSKWWKQFDLGEELDKLYEKVIETTELRKLATDKIKIDFRNSLYFLREGSLEQTTIPGMYFHDREMIYIFAEKANREVLAHEMTHAALHRYAGVRFPRGLDEAVAIWAAEKLK